MSAIRIARCCALALLSSSFLTAPGQAQTAPTPTPIRAEPERTLVLNDVAVPGAGLGESWLVVANTAGMPQSFAVRFFNPQTGAERSRWQSPPIASNTALTVPVRDMLGGGPITTEGLATQTLAISGAVTLSVQHLIVRDGAVRAEAACGAALDGAPKLIGNVFGASAQPGFTSIFEAVNTSGAPLETRVVLLDPVNGLPTYSWVETVPGFATRQISIPQLEARVGAVIGGFWSRYTARIEGDARVRVRHRVFSGTAGIATDATVACALSKTPEVTIQTP